MEGPAGGRAPRAVGRLGARAPTFVDTNVLVYAQNASDRRGSTAQRVLGELWESRSGTLSTQDLQEFYVVVTCKLTTPLPPRTAREIVALYGQWSVIQIDLALILEASRLEERHQLSFWVSLILVAAGRAGVDRVLTEDLQAGRSFSGIKIENPYM